MSLLISTEAGAANRLLAVLPLDGKMAQGWLSEAAKSSIEEMVRDEAANALAPAGWTVLTGETMLQVLADNGIDPAKCGDQTCHLTIAREINAEMFVSGAVQFVDGEYTASIRLIDTKSGRIVSTERLSGKSVHELRESFVPKAQDFFKRGGLIGQPPVEVEMPVARQGTLMVVSEPPGATVLVDGEEVGKTPLRRLVSAGTYDVGVQMDGYVPVWKSVNVDSSREIVLSERMVPEREFVQTVANGFINVAGVPDGANVTIDGEPSAPGRQGPFAPGNHIVRVEADGYQVVERRVSVSSGNTTTANVTMTPSFGELVVTVNASVECEAHGSRFMVSPSNPRHLRLPTGETVVTCHRNGFGSVVQTVNVTPDATVVVPIVMAGRAVDESTPALTEGDSAPVFQLEVKRHHHEIEIIPDNGESSLVIEPARQAPRAQVFEPRAYQQEDVRPRVAEPRVYQQQEEVLPPVSWAAPENGRASQVDPMSGLEFIWMRGNAPANCDPEDVFCNGEDVLGTRATVSAMWMSKKPVTVAAYAKCVRAGACQLPRVAGRCHWGPSQGSLPMNCVDWQQAKNFCAWIGGRLPNVEEWENAATGGKTRAQQIDADFRQGFDEESDTRVASVSPRTEMTGQLWEWTGTSSGTKKVLSKLLGSLGAPPAAAPSHRFTDPLFQDDSVGFRCGH